MANLFAAYVVKKLYEYAEVCPGERLPREVNYVFDDFACGARVHNFPKYIAIFREKGISTTLLVQDLAQLIGLYGESEAATIANNCDTQIFMGGMDGRTVSSMATRLNVPSEDVAFLPIGEEYVLRRGEKGPVRTTRYSITENQLFQEVGQLYREGVEL